MQRRTFLQSTLASGGIAAMPALATAAEPLPKHPKPAREFFELRTYTLKPDKRQILDEYFRAALIPALNRSGIKQVGVFHEIPAPANPTSPTTGTAGAPVALLLIRYENSNQIAAETSAALAAEMASISASAVVMPTTKAAMAARTRARTPQLRSTLTAARRSIGSWPTRTTAGPPMSSSASRRCTPTPGRSSKHFAYAGNRRAFARRTCGLGCVVMRSIRTSSWRLGWQSRWSLPTTGRPFRPPSTSAFKRPKSSIGSPQGRIGAGNSAAAFWSCTNTRLAVATSSATLARTWKARPGFLSITG